MRKFSPLRAVWFRPAQTVSRVAHENPDYRLLALPIVAGFATWPTVAFFYPEEDTFRVGLFWSALLTVGPLFELFQVFVGAYLIQLSGRWLGGRAGLQSIQTAVAWGNVPVALIAVISIPLAFMSMVLTQGADADLVGDPTPAIVLFGYFLAILQVGLIAWSIVILILGLAAVQGYKLVHAIANTLMAWLIPSLLIVLLVMNFSQSESVFGVFFDGFYKLFLVHAN